MSAFINGIGRTKFGTLTKSSLRFIAITESTIK